MLITILLPLPHSFNNLPLVSPPKLRCLLDQPAMVMLLGMV